MAHRRPRCRTVDALGCSVFDTFDTQLIAHDKTDSMIKLSATILTILTSGRPQMTSCNFGVKLTPPPLSHLVTNLGSPLPKLRHKLTVPSPFKKTVIIACRNMSDFSFIIPTSAVNVTLFACDLTHSAVMQPAAVVIPADK